MMEVKHEILGIENQKGKPAWKVMRPSASTRRSWKKHIESAARSETPLPGEEEINVCLF